MSAVTSENNVLKAAIDNEIPLGALFNVTDDQFMTFAAVGYNCFQQGQLEDAETIFRGLVALNSLSYLGYAGLGALYLHQGHLDAAEANLKVAIQLAPDQAGLYANLFETYLKMAKFDEAEGAYKKALELDPNANDEAVNRAANIVNALGLVFEECKRQGINLQ